MNAELKALKRFRNAKIKCCDIGCSGDNKRIGKNHKILARFCTQIALHGFFKSLSTSKKLTLEIVDDA